MTTKINCGLNEWMSRADGSRRELATYVLNSLKRVGMPFLIGWRGVQKSQKAGAYFCFPEAFPFRRFSGVGKRDLGAASAAHGYSATPLLRYRLQATERDFL